MKRRIEGYWYNEYTEKYTGIVYPIPVPNILTDSQASEIYELILLKQEDSIKTSYRGFSESRITSETLGNEEYVSDEWIWTGDLAKHYVLDHKVKPSNDFLEYIGYDISVFDNENEYVFYEQSPKTNSETMEYMMNDMVSELSKSIDADIMKELLKMNKNKN